MYPLDHLTHPQSQTDDNILLSMKNCSCDVLCPMVSSIWLFSLEQKNCFIRTEKTWYADPCNIKNTMMPRTTTAQKRCRLWQMMPVCASLSFLSSSTCIAKESIEKAAIHAMLVLQATVCAMWLAMVLLWIHRKKRVTAPMCITMHILTQQLHTIWLICSS